MTSILNRISAAFRSSFEPTNPDEYFALRLANKLGQPAMARQLSFLAAEHARPKIISAFNRSFEAALAQGEIARHFLSELTSEIRSATSVPNHPLVAMRIERRAIAAAVFNGPHLETVRIRHLSSRPEKAQASALSFIRAIAREFHVESVALELFPSRQEVHRAVLNRLIRQQVRDEGISLWEIGKKSMIASFAHPAPKTRSEVRKIIVKVWPHLNETREERPILDAIALGLFVQTERLFNHLDTQPL
jgi:hypothetical protein